MSGDVEMIHMAIIKHAGVTVIDVAHCNNYDYMTTLLDLVGSIGHPLWLRGKTFEESKLLKPYVLLERRPSGNSNYPQRTQMHQRPQTIHNLLNSTLQLKSQVLWGRMFSSLFPALDIQSRNKPLRDGAESVNMVCSSYWTVQQSISIFVDCHNKECICLFCGLGSVHFWKCSGNPP